MIIKELGSCNDGLLEQLVQLDKQSVDKYGESFSDEIWTKYNFMFDLPLKKTKSLVALDGSLNVLGYCIISLKENLGIYIHRFVTKKTLGYNVSKFLMDEVLTRNRNVCLVVSKINKPAIDFYTKNGFRIVPVKIAQKILDRIDGQFSTHTFDNKNKYFMEKRMNKRILCNISGHELPNELTDDMQLVQTYTKILDVFDEVHFVCRSTKLKNDTIKHPNKPIYVHHVSVPDTILGKTIIAAIRLYCSAKSKIKDYGVDCFIASDPTIGGVACFLLKMLNGKKYILEVQAEMTRISPKVVGWSKAKLFKWLTLFVARFAFRVRAVSETVAQQLIEDGLDPNKLRVVTSRVKLDKFNYHDYELAGQEIRKKYSILPEEQLFLFVGRLVVFKGVTFLLQALSKFDSVRYKLLIVGDGPLNTELKNEVLELGLKDKVIFNGGVDFSQVPYFMACADLIILPSTDEGFPRVMLEAMAMKKLVIGSLVGGVRDIALEGINGYFFPSQNPLAIKQTLEKVYSDDKQKKLIENAYKMVTEEYEFEKVMVNYNNLLRELL